MPSPKISIAASVALTLLLGACSSTGGDATKAPRTITVTASDELTFDPASIEVSVGETVRFEIVNEGELDHEFILGDQKVQEDHETAMAHGGHDPAGALAAIEAPAGETVEQTVTFETASQLIYGCHVTGHYSGGMLGTLKVKPA